MPRSKETKTRPPTEMPEKLSDAIAEMLAEVEETEGVRVCLAVESGSRAWGFASTDSDFDVRFIYVHHPDWYLSIEDGRDVIERPLTNLIDLNGWDLRKALRLFQKSNPPLLEWLRCPIVYKESSSVGPQLRALLPRFFSPQASFFHYLHMARGNFREYLRGERVWRKKYLYVLRPLLAIQWIEADRGAVPIEFRSLLQASNCRPEVLNAIEALIVEKVQGMELDEGPRIEEISNFIEGELSRLEDREVARREPVGETQELDRLFRNALAECWPRSNPPPSF